MYEVDFTGWTRTPEELKKLKENKSYRFRMNRKILWRAVLLKKWYTFFSWYNWSNLIFNRNNF